MCVMRRGILSQFAGLVAGEIVGGGGLTLTQDRRSEILLTSFFPFDHAEARRIVDDTSGADGQAGDDALIAIHASPATIDVAVLAGKFLNDGDVRVFADRQCAEFGAMNFTSRIHGGALDEFVERHTHGTEFREDVVVAEDGVVSTVQVGGNGVWQETLLDRGNSVTEPEAACAVADIKDDAALASFEKDGIEFAIGKNDGELLSEDVGVNVAGAGFFQDEIGVGAIGAGPEIEHDGTMGGVAASNGVIDSGPRGVFTVPGFIRPVVGRFHTDDEVGIFLDGVGAALHIHFVDILFETTAHTVGDNIEEGEDADGGVIHDAFFFLEKGFRASGTGVDDGGDAGLQDEISGNGVGLDVGAGGRIKPVERRTTVGNVHVNIDKAGSDIEAGDIDHLGGGGSWDIFLYRGDFAGGDRDIHDAINVVGGIDDVAAFQDEIIGGRLSVSGGEQGEKSKSYGQMQS